MKRFALALYAGFLTYLLASVLLGPASPSSMRALAEERSRIQANLEDLRRLKADYERRIGALRSDPSAQALAARSLGYLAQGERLVRVEGLPPKKRRAVAGRILSLKEGSAPGRALALPIGASVFALVLLAGAVVTKESNHAPRQARSR
jgi:hypothetical protein